MRSFHVSVISRFFHLALLVTAFLFTQSLPAVGQNPGQSQGTAPVKLSLIPEKNVIFLDEPIFLRLQIISETPDQFEFVRPDGIVAETTTMSVGQIKGDFLPPLPGTQTQVNPSAKRKDPCSVYTPAYFLPRLTSFHDTGKYFLKFQTGVEVRERKTGVRTALLVTGDFQLEVVPRTDEKVKQAVEAYGSRLVGEGPDFDEALEKIVSIKDQRAVPYLAQVLKAHFNDPQRDEAKEDPQLDERLFRAVKSSLELMRFDDEKAVEALREAMTCPNITIRRRVAEFLGPSRNERHRSILKGAWRDSDHRVRCAVAQALALYPATSETESILNRLLNDENSEVRTEARESLKYLESLKSKAKP